MNQHEQEQVESFFPIKRLPAKLGSRPSIRLKQKTLVHDEIYKRATREGRYKYGRKSVPKVQGLGEGNDTKPPQEKSDRVVRKGVYKMPQLPRNREIAGLTCMIGDWSVAALHKKDSIMVLAENIETDECKYTVVPTITEAQTVFRQYCKEVSSHEA